MTTTTSSPAPRKRRGVLKTLLWIFGLLAVLLVVAYFVGTSAGFLKGVILPKVSKTINADVTVSDASISPFSSVVLKDLKVQAKGHEPVVTAKEMRAHYSLMDIIKGHIKVDEVVLDSPVVQIIKGPDGRSNLDPILDSMKSEKKSAEPKKSSKPPELDINKVSLINATVRMLETPKEGGRNLTELTGVNVNIANVRNGQTGKMDLAANVNVDKIAGKEGTNGALNAKVDGNFTFALTSDLNPGTVKGATRVNVTSAQGGMADLANFGVNLDCDIDPTMIKQVALRFQKGETQLGELLVNGPFDMNKKEGKLNVVLQNIDKRLLNTVGGPKGIDFGSTSISSTNQIEVAKGASIVTAIGQLNASAVSITQEGKTTPTLDVQLAYNVTVNQNDKSALLQTFNLNGLQNQKQILKGELTNPMKVAWGEATAQTGDATLNLLVTGLNLGEWKAFAADLAPNGLVNATMKLVSEQSGKQLTFNLDSGIENFSAKVGTNSIQPVMITLNAKGQAIDMKKFDVSEYRFQLAQQNQWMLLASGSANYDKTTEEANAQFTLESQLARLFPFLGQPDLQASGGMLTLKSKVTQKKNAQTVTANFALSDLSGKLKDYSFDRFGVAADMDLEKQDTVLRIRKANGSLRQSGNPGGTFNASGSFDTAKKSGQLDLKLDDLNQNTLQTFLASALKDKKLVTVSVNATTSAKIDPNADSSIKAEFAISKLVVSDPEQPKPIGPLEAKLSLDSSLQKQVLDLRKAQLTLTPTDRAKNQMQISGKVDMTQTNAIQGALKLVAESLDLTPYYDIVSGDNGQPAAPGGKPAPAPGSNRAPTPSKPAGEPVAVNLPFKNFTVDVNVGHVYLREVDISDWQTGLRLDGSHVLIKPLQFAMNGRPVTGNVDLNLGVPGYQYDVALNMDRIALAPLANTFSPKFRGAAKGELLANVQIKGAGTTGVNLQKYLTGQMGFTVTNADIKLPEDYKYKKVLDLISVPLAAYGIPDLSKYALQWVNANVTMGEGKINLSPFQVQSEVYTLKTQGSIPIANELTNSPLPNLPVELALRRDLALKASLAPSDTPANVAFAPLPVFAHVGGTIGNADAKIDKVVLATTVARAAANKFNLPGKVGGDAGKLLQGVLGGGANTNAPAGTNTNKPTSGSILQQGLQGILGGGAKTNAPADTNKPAPAPGGGLLDIFRKK
ncbi:MAG: hypothetical protein JWM16_3934 [Verrucomicrobiales bacterium]|nr:hypothetical protein [Verrucomicrobiales bacterium]